MNVWNNVEGDTSVCFLLLLAPTDCSHLPAIRCKSFLVFLFFHQTISFVLLIFSQEKAVIIKTFDRPKTRWPPANSFFSHLVPSFRDLNSHYLQKSGKGQFATKDQLHLHRQIVHRCKRCPNIGLQLPKLPPGQISAMLQIYNFNHAFQNYISIYLNLSFNRLTCFI